MEERKYVLQEELDRINYIEELRKDWYFYQRYKNEEIDEVFKIKYK